MAETNKKTGVIVLAAGASRRMNEPKQLLEYEGRTLLRRAVETAVAADCQPIVVVLGANYEKTKAEIAELDVAVCFNADWRDGLSSSLKRGLEKLFEIDANVDGFLVSLADQPLVAAHHLRRFVEKFGQTRERIVAAEYGGIVGVPAIFGREYLADFDEISGDRGAKAVIEKHRRDLTTIELPEAAFDVDTQEDFSNLTAEIRA